MLVQIDCLNWSLKEKKRIDAEKALALVGTAITSEDGISSQRTARMIWERRS